MKTCPMDDYTCPYYRNNNCCMEEMEGADPVMECDSFADVWEDDYDECGFDPYEGCYTYDC